MFPDLFPAVAASADVTEQLGSNPVRFFAFGYADQNTPRPYATYQNVGGSPENYLSCIPDVDTNYIQIDVYAGTQSSALATAKALRDVIQTDAYVTAWRGQSRDPATMDYRISFDIQVTEQRT